MVIPKTKFLFNLIKPYLVGKLSINDILSYLEPFMIYQQDLSFMQYKEMNEFIFEKIHEFRKNYIAKSREYEKIKGTQSVFISPIVKLLDDKTYLKDIALNAYGFTDTVMQMTTADFIRRINEVDRGQYYFNTIASSTKELVVDGGSEYMAEIEKYLNNEAEEGTSTVKATGKSKSKANATDANATHANASKNTSSSACNLIKIIAKRYIELDELREDNGKEIYFDKKYDITAYNIGEQFKVNPNLPLGNQIQHYMDKLIKNKKYNERDAKRDAEAIIKGKRTVGEGEYAILETTDENSATVQYYVRKNENWVLDDSIDSETFADSMKMFCNLNEKCIAVKEDCHDQETGAAELKKHNLELMMEEFGSKLRNDAYTYKIAIEREIDNSKERLLVLQVLNQTKLYKYETYKVLLGNMVEAKEIIISPYDDLLKAILGLPDLSKRYLDLSNFVISFLREAIEYNTDESKYWLYCIKSGKQMLPAFIYTLVKTFLQGGDYAAMLEKICAQQGTISEDGDKWVDKYSGYTIKMIESSTDEEYNEAGFKVTSRAVIEGDIGESILKNINKEQNLDTGTGIGIVTYIKEKPRKYATPDATKIYMVIETMNNNMGINIESQKDSIVMNVLKQLSSTAVMPSKAAYDKLFALSAAKGKTIDNYENAFNSTLLFLTLSYYLIAIQLSIPPIKTKTTFPGCKKFFNGFPTDGTDNMKGITYVACVANKIKLNGTLPWSAITNRNAIAIAKQMEANITKFIIMTEDVQNDIKELKQYLLTNPEQDIPAEHNVANWYNFLPPLKPLKIATVQDVGEVFKSRLLDSMRKGQAVSHEYINEIQAKMILFSFNIIDLIEKTLQGEQAILRSNNGEPFVENACCNVSESNTLQYFIQKQPEIAILNNKVVRLSDLYEDAKNISKAVVIFDPSNTKRVIRQLPENFSEDTIYRAFIAYCNFNTLVPLSDNMKAICPTKPENFDSHDSLDESIRKLKSDARNYTEKSLQQLLEVINISTKQPILIVEKTDTNIPKLSEIINQMDTENVRPSVFRTAFMEILETFEINALLEDTAQLRKFKNILAHLNEEMQKEILTFIENSSTNIKGASFREFKQCIETISQFKEVGDDLFFAKKEETGYKMINFMKKSMRCLTCEFPNIIMNKVEFKGNKTVPMHWKLSEQHVSDVKAIIESHYAILHSFYNDKQIQMLLEKLTHLSKNIYELAQNTLLYTPVEIKSKRGTTPAQAEEKNAPTGTGTTSTGTTSTTSSSKRNTFKYSAFDVDLTTLLFRFYFYSVLTDLISLQTDQDILHSHLLESETDDEALFALEEDQEVLLGNQVQLAEKIASIIVTFTNLICKDKNAINYNYKSLMEMVLRSKEKEKDDITDYLKNMTDEEREVENLFKGNKLGRWSKGEQKGIHTYDKETYDLERDDMEKMAIREARMNKRSVVTDMNRDIFVLEELAEEAAGEDLDAEDNNITYMGEDADFDEYDMDGDENY